MILFLEILSFTREYFLAEENIEEDETEEAKKKKKQKKKNVEQEDQNMKPEKKKSEVKLEKKRIYEGIKHVAEQEGKEEDFVKLLVLYMFGTLFFTNCNATYIHYKYLNCVQSVDTMNMISWPDEIHEHLMESIASVTRNKSKTKTVTGCTVYLLLWFLEHVRNIKRKPNTDNLPRFARWNLYDGSSELEGMLDSLSKEKVSQEFVVAFTDEEKKLGLFEQSEVQTLKAEVQELKNEVKVKDKIIFDLNGAIEALKSRIEMLRENQSPRKPLLSGSPLPVVIYTPTTFNLNVTQEMKKVVTPEEPVVGNIQVDPVAEEPVAEVPVVEEPINAVHLATVNEIDSIVRNVKHTYATRKKIIFDGFVTGELKKQKTE
ncbi:uncharacterized protein LOC113330241 isoform X1 [Papaver somniferum]|uniref:uncharacterized protein LOC113330241 isoform X1 n=1 Tax=Papaver somniferum TaxID=3469 RepID=UPI000E705BE8|nr:uncharacterized protein LOC113330241 isoform X1 [Papaver somniferum]XP_026432892.1 uncharacterized protein LOC113330241 isoform X1 [Papaver somniferum]XP_026432893.1 uncharacterized protein LOC113330241 isoform X1 [Papaver somniferum]